MANYRRILLNILSFSGLLFLTGCQRAGVLAPKGVIAAAEKHLFFDAVFLMLIIVIPVMVLTVLIVRRYRASNLDATYSPEWTHSTLLEVIWWGIPCVIIAILATMTWITSHTLDPYRPLEVEGKPLEIQVVALDWRWLFIYPEQHIASVNYVKFPAHVPVRFLITADAPMNSFQIPQLAGQIYAMSGMQTQLNIMATEEGNYTGQSTNFSGDGFSDMRFVANATTQADFDDWVLSMKKGNNKLTWDTYRALAKQSDDTSVISYASVSDDLFKNIIMSYMMPGMENAEKTAFQKNVIDAKS